jgi:cell division protein FtsL
MAAYMHGSLAVEEKVIKEQKINFRETKRKVYRNRAIPAQEKLLYLFTVVLCVIVAGTIIWRYSQIYAMNSKIHDIETQIRQLKVDNDNLKQQWNQANDPDRLRKDAEKTGLTLTNPDSITHLPSKPTLSKNADSKVAALSH